MEEIRGALGLCVCLYVCMTLPTTILHKIKQHTLNYSKLYMQVHNHQNASAFQFIPLFWYWQPWAQCPLQAAMLFCSSWRDPGTQHPPSLVHVENMPGKKDLNIYFHIFLIFFFGNLLTILWKKLSKITVLLFLVEDKQWQLNHATGCQDDSAQCTLYKQNWALDYYCCFLLCHFFSLLMQWTTKGICTDEAHKYCRSIFKNSTTQTI